MRNGTGQTGGGRNQTLMVLLQQCQIHTGFAIKAVDKCLGHHAAQIFIALPVFAQKQQVIAVIVDPMYPVGHRPSGHIDLTADNRFDPRCLGCFIEINTAIHNTVIGNGNRILPQLFDPIHHAVNAAGTVQETVLTMDVQMHKTHCVPSFAI